MKEMRPPLRILVIGFSNIPSDPRIMRQLNCMKRLAHLTVAGFFNTQINDIECIELNKPRLGIFFKIFFALLLAVRCYRAAYWSIPHHRQARKLLKDRRLDVIVCNDIDACPVGFVVANQISPVLIDAHEYAPRQKEHEFAWRTLFGPYNRWMCKQYLPRATKMITVSEGLSRAYAKEFGIDAPQVISNAPYYSDLHPKTREDDKIKLVHHGGAAWGRQLHKMAEAMSLVDDRFHLTFMLLDHDAGCLKFLKEKYRSDRIAFVDPVSVERISETLNSNYDIGIYLLDPVNFNFKYALPNKIFEFIQARLGVVVSPNPEMAKLVREKNIGSVATDFSVQAFADALNSLTRDQIKAFKRNSHFAAKQYNSENNCRQFVDIITSIKPSC